MTGRRFGVAVAVGLGLGGLAHFALLGFGFMLVEHQEKIRFAQRSWRIEEVASPPRVIKINDSKIKKGWVVVMDQGRSESWRALVRRDGLAGRIVLRLKRLETGQATRVVVGTSEKDNPVKMPRLARVARSIQVEATAYDPGPVDYERGWVGRTSIGERARFGIVAVDPNVIPYRSLLYVEGYGLGLAADTGGAIKGRRLDLCFNSTREALRWGRRKTRVHLLGVLPRSERAGLRMALEAD